MVQAVTRGPLTAEARIRSRGSPCVIVDDKVAMGQGFSPSTSVFPSQYHSNITPYETFNGTLTRRACW